MPFTSVEDMYLNTKFRLALMPATTHEDNFKYSPDPLWQKIYNERLQPHLDEYAGHVSAAAMVLFIREDFKTVAYGDYKTFT